MYLSMYFGSLQLRFIIIFNHYYYQVRDMFLWVTTTEVLIVEQCYAYIPHPPHPTAVLEECRQYGNYCSLNTLRPRQNGRHFADDIFKCIFLNENIWIAIKNPLKLVPKGPINNIPALVRIMAWRRPGDKPLSEPMMASLLTHICVTRPQWVNTSQNLARARLLLLQPHQCDPHSCSLLKWPLMNSSNSGRAGRVLHGARGSRCEELKCLHLWTNETYLLQAKEGLVLEHFAIWLIGYVHWPCFSR